MPNSLFKYKIILNYILSVIITSPCVASYPELSLFDVAPQQTPDLYWDPEPFIPIEDPGARYIDYENGNDEEAGTQDRPWKHHPWDPNATSRAAASSGIRTYFFKKGVIYRGHLVAKESGKQNSPIRLTIDPEWGQGDAILVGSVMINSGWQRCAEEEASILPAASRSKTWCREFNAAEKPWALWESDGTKTTRVVNARTPNWKISVPQDTRFEWPELEDAIAVVEITLANTDGFKVNDEIWLVSERGAPRSTNRSSVNRYRINEIRNQALVIEGSGWRKGKLRKGVLVSNGIVSGRIEHISNAHQTIWHLIDRSNDFLGSVSELQEAVIWVERTTVPKPVAAIINSHDPETGSITTNLHIAPVGGPRAHSRYYLEGAPDFLDSPGEFYYASRPDTSGMLYLRLQNDRNPNDSRIEVAAIPIILDIRDQSYIHISGLSFRFSNQIQPGTRASRQAALYASSIQIRGSVSGIQIHHNQFENLMAGIVAYPVEGRSHDYLDYLDISENYFADIDGQAIALGSGRDRVKFRGAGARLVHVNVSRNKLERIGLQTMGHWGMGSHGHGIEINGAEVVEVGGNHINYSGGSGILVLTGASYDRGKISRPFLRSLIHHNKVTNSLLQLKDYGGIAAWMGGPTFIYNNISGNPVGYIHAKTPAMEKRPVFRRDSYGIGIYLDGQYKGYVFNNIVWGYNNEVQDRYYNAAAFNEAMGFMHTVFHNTLFRFAVGLHKGMTQHNRCYYISNNLIDMGHKFIQQEPRNDVIDYDTLAFRKNVFSGISSDFGQLGRGNKHVYKTINEWEAGLRKNKALAYETGVYTTDDVVHDKDSLDFRPVPDSVVVNAGSKVFVPWPLYQVVGEWNFMQSRSSPEVIHGENISMNKEWVNRTMFQDIPRNNLACVGVEADDYKPGVLEDWINGALWFDGKNTYCFMRNSDLVKGYRWTELPSGKSGYVRGADRDTVDMTTNNFLIEAVIRIEPDQVSVPIASKIDGQGYVLDINEDGGVRLSLQFKGHSAARSSSVSINDGSWHHVVAEVDRHDHRGISIYVDGVLENGPWEGEMDSMTSLSNPGDFLVGHRGKTYLAGSIDFLRISKGTLKAAETSIDELYQWQFDGPFLKDFSGNQGAGDSRDAGAVESDEGR